MCSEKTYLKKNTSIIGSRLADTTVIPVEIVDRYGGLAWRGSCGLPRWERLKVNAFGLFCFGWDPC